MAFTDAFARKQSGRAKAWPLLGPLLEEPIEGFDPGVGEAIFPYYRKADRDYGAELAAAALSGYQLAAIAAGLLKQTQPGDAASTSYHFTGHVGYVADSLEAVADWLANVYEMILPRGTRPNLASKDFANRFAMIDLAASQTFSQTRPWVEEVFTLRRQVRYRNAQSWREEAGQAVAAGLSVRPVGERRLGGVKPRRVEGMELNELANVYLEKLAKMLLVVFVAGADRLAEPREREDDIDWD